MSDEAGTVVEKTLEENEAYVEELKRKRREEREAAERKEAEKRGPPRAPLKLVSVEERPKQDWLLTATPGFDEAVDAATKAVGPLPEIELPPRRDEGIHKATEKAMQVL